MLPHSANIIVHRCPAGGERGGGISESTDARHRDVQVKLRDNRIRSRGAAECLKGGRNGCHVHARATIIIVTNIQNDILLDPLGH